ncbi:MAG TPA: hypothetical protein PLX41_07400 [Bacteroidales bacterium]|jgi:hypothetical protein|nr:hypothetical protein [Bacteroidales bacterium]
MKKIALILIIGFITAMAVSSCNREICPAYTSVETVQSESQG